MTSTGLIVAAAVLLIGTAAGLWRRRTDGRLRSAAPARLRRHGPADRAAGALSLTVSAVGVPGVGVPGVGVPGVGVPGVGAPSVGVPDAGVSERVDRDVADSGADPGAAGQRLDPDLLTALGVGPAQATLLQFSSAFCAPCRAVRRVSSEVAALLPGVRHVEVDAESHLDAVRALGIWRTPTLLVLDKDGRVAKRATGVPAKPQLIAVLGEILPAA